MVKLRQKVSGLLTDPLPEANSCAIRSYLATAAKHGIHFFAALTTLAVGSLCLPTIA
jgi:hypothetical protein